MEELADVALDAKEDAVREVAKLLALPENLENISTLRAEYAQKKQAVDAQLSSTVQTQVAEGAWALKSMDRCKDTLDNLRSNFETIDRLCEECSSLIENHELINALNIALRNLDATIDCVESITDIPMEAAAVLELLDDNKDLLAAFEALRAVDRRRQIAQTAISASRDCKSRSSELLSLQQYFDEVDRAQARFEETLWRHVRNFLHLGKHNPALLVQVLQVVYAQEQLDRHAKERQDTRARADHPPDPPLHYQAKCMECVEESIQERFEGLLGPAVEVDVKAALHTLSVLGDELTDVYDYVAPCFPPDFDVFPAVVRAYSAQIEALFQRLAESPDAMSNQDIVDVIAWAERYSQHLQALGVGAEHSAARLLPRGPDAALLARALPAHPNTPRRDPSNPFSPAPGPTPQGPEQAEGASRGDGSNPFLEEDDDAPGIVASLDAFLAGAVPTPGPAAPPSNPFETPPAASDPPPEPRDKHTGSPGLVKLMDVFVARMLEGMKGWCGNIIRHDQETQPKLNAQGQCWTPSTVDLFRLLNDQVSIVQEVHTGELLFKVGAAAIEVMGLYQELYLRWVRGAGPSGALSLEQLAAVINNNVHCYELSEEFADSLESAFDAPYQGHLEIEAACRGFLEVAKEGMKQLQAAVFADPGLIDCVQRLFTPEWAESAHATDTLAATLQDYLGDLQRWVEPGFFKRVAEGALRHTVATYCGRFMGTAGTGGDWWGGGGAALTLKAETIARLEEDEELLRDCFADFLPDRKVKAQVQKAADLRELAAATDAESFVLSYSMLLQSDLHCPPAAVDKILQAREDISRKDRAEVMKQCQEVYEVKQHKQGGQQGEDAEGAAGDAATGAFEGVITGAQSGWRKAIAATMMATHAVSMTHAE